MEALLKSNENDRLLIFGDVSRTPFEGAGKIVQQIERELPACIGAELSEMFCRGNAMLLLSAGLQLNSSSISVQ